MQDLVSLIAFFVVGFLLSFGVAWTYVRIATRQRRQAEPVVGAILRIRAGSGMYRSQIVRLGRSAWTISAPLQRDSYVPLRVGEEIVIEAPGKKGALVFRSTVIARDATTHEVVIERPTTVHEVERREHKRWPHLIGQKLTVEGTTARILDISQGGARVETKSRTHRGDRLRIDTPWGQTLYGWVLDSEPGQARIRFEELVEIRPGKRETAPAL